MNILHRIQNQPERSRKIILWSVVIIIGLSLATWWIKNLQQRLKSFPAEELKEQLQLPPLEEELKGLPKIEMPKINEEQLKKLEKTLKQKPYEKK